MREKEIYNLLNQFKTTMGIKTIDIHSKAFQNDFKEWLRLRQMQGYRYMDFLYELNNSVIERTTAEVGKSRFDTVVVPFDTTIISPYDYKSFPARERIIPATLLAFSEPLLYFPDSKKAKLECFSTRSIDTIMTQNPYSRESISGYENLHNSGNIDIAVGAFGSIYDKNIKENLEMLKSLRQKISDGEYRVDYNHDGDIYFIALISDRARYRKIKVKTKLR